MNEHSHNNTDGNSADDRFRELAVCHLAGELTSRQANEFDSLLATSDQRCDELLTIAWHARLIASRIGPNLCENGTWVAPLARSSEINGSRSVRSPVLSFLHERSAQFGGLRAIGWMVSMVFLGCMVTFAGLAVWNKGWRTNRVVHEAKSNMPSSTPGNVTRTNDDAWDRQPSISANHEQRVAASTSRPEQSLLPTELPNLHAWWKADSITGVSTGQRVFTWADSSGNGHHMSVVDGSPTYNAHFLNGQPSIHLNTASDSFKTDIVFGLNGDPAYTLFVVLARSSAYVGEGFFAFGSGESPGLHDVMLYIKHDNHLSVAGGFGRDYNTLFAGPWGGNIVSIKKTSGAINATTAVRINGLDVSPGTTNMGTNNIPLHTFAWIGASRAISMPGATNADVAEVIVYRRVLTRDEESGITHYLSKKFDLPAP